jgi:hypothetical protein
MKVLAEKQYPADSFAWLDLSPHVIMNESLHHRRTPEQPQHLPQLSQEDIVIHNGYTHYLIASPLADPAENLRNPRDRPLRLTLSDSGLCIHEAYKLLCKQLD